MVVKALQNVADPSRSEIGEIDTRAPFRSVKAAVSMFGESSSSPEKPTSSFKRLRPQTSEELRRIKAQESARGAHNSAYQQEVDAKHLADISSDHANQLSEDMTSIQESIVHVKLASAPDKQEESRVLSDSVTEEYMLALEKIKQNLAFSKDEYDPELAVDLEVQLEKITYEISSVTKDLENAKAFDSIVAMTNMLEDAKSTLSLVMEEARILRSLVETLNLERDETKRIQLELRRKEDEEEYLVGHLEAKLQESKAKLEFASVRESKAREACDDLTSALNRLLLESESAIRVMKMNEINTEQVRKDADAACVVLGELEKQLHEALVEVEMAKTSEAKALNQIKVLSEETSLARNSAPDLEARIKISVEEFQSLGRKVEELETSSKTKVDAAMMQIEALMASEHKVNEKIDAILKEIEAVELEEAAAINRAETAEASIKAMEHEMKKLQDEEQKGAEETASRTLADMEVRVPASPLKVTVPRLNTSAGNKMTRENSRARKWSLVPNIFGIFYRKKTEPDVGSPSYVSGEKQGLLAVLE